MAVIRVGSVDRYVATSGATKPTTAAEGSELYEVNTGLHYIYDGTTWGKISGKIDDTVSAMRTIGVEHAEIHAGEHFTATYSETVGTGTSVTVMISAPTATKKDHLIFFVQASNSITAVWSETPNASGGSAITAYNNDRDSTTTSLSTLVSAITYTSSGTTLQAIQLGGTNAGTRLGGTGGAREEWILASSGTYLMKADADNASTKVVLEFYWYED